MLNGIGGATIEEAKESITPEEALAWAKYMRKRGGLNVGMRLEQGIAMILAMMVNRSGGIGRSGAVAYPADYIVHGGDDDEEDENATLEDVMSVLIQARR